MTNFSTKINIVILFFFMLCLCLFSQIKAEEVEIINKITLNCLSEEAWDLKENTKTKLSGGFTLSLLIFNMKVKNGNFLYGKISGMELSTCYEFYGSASNVEFDAECENELDLKKELIKINENIIIDRTTGEYSSKFIVNDEPVSIHYGNCSKASQLF